MTVLRSLECVLQHITNIYGSIPIGHSTALKEKYDAKKSVLQHIKYNDHQRGRFKDGELLASTTNWLQEIPMLSLLLGQQR